MSDVVPQYQCTICLQWKRKEEFYSKKENSIKGVASWCKSCRKEYIRNHPEANKRYYSKNRDKINSYRNKRNQEIRKKFLDLYGNKCDCCGETEPVFLALDHVKGVNRRHKISNPYDNYLIAIKEFDTTEYRILCHNCNQATKHGKICPHQLKKEL